MVAYPLFLVIVTTALANLPFQIINAKFRPPSAENATRRVKRTTDKAKNVTFLLNSVLENYNRHFRPGFNTDRPTRVYIDLLVRTMGPVSELTDTYSFNCYFRQTWTDPRLRFNGSSHRLSLSMAMLDRIWKPDTYFLNGARSYIHTMTNSNRLVRLYPDGTVLYSSRLTVQGRCSMAMNRYPLDRQACRLLIGSYAYNAKELSYSWKDMDGDKGVQLDHKGISDLPQFSLTGFQVFDAVNVTRDREYSVLEARFYFDRHFGYFLMNFYVPCTLIVLLCWVAFWTNREGTGDRMGMGVTSVLTMVLISNDSKKDAPKVDIPTALDVYIWICYSTLFICMVEFTVVHYFTKFNTGDPEIQEAEREKLRRIIKSIPKNAFLSSRGNRRIPQGTTVRKISGQQTTFSRRDGGRHSMYHRRKRMTEDKKPVTPQPSTDLDEKEEFHRENVGWRMYYWMVNNSRSTDPFGVRENSISMVDRFARVALPLTFGCVVFLYYHFYVNTPHEFRFDEQLAYS